VKREPKEVEHGRLDDVMAGIILIGVVVAFQWIQCKAGHIAYWQQQREFEQRKGEVASRLPDSLESRQKMDHAKASVERIDGESSRLAGSKRAAGHHAS